MASLMKSNTYRINTNLSQTLPKSLARRDHFLTHNMRPALPWYQNQAKTLQEKTLQEKTLQTNIHYEYRCKNPQEITSKLNSAADSKDDTPWPSGIHPRNARMVQHMKINIIYYINRMKKKTYMIIATDIEKPLTKSNLSLFTDMWSYT